MNFASEDFIGFVIVVFVIYWFLQRKSQNFFLLLASYFFYAQWDWRFLSLIMFSTAVDYIAGSRLYNSTSPNGRKFWLTVSLVTNLSSDQEFKICDGNVALESGTHGLRSARTYQQELWQVLRP